MMRTGKRRPRARRSLAPQGSVEREGLAPESGTSESLAPESETSEGLDRASRENVERAAGDIPADVASGPSLMEPPTVAERVFFEEREPPSPGEDVTDEPVLDGAASPLARARRKRFRDMAQAIVLASALLCAVAFARGLLAGERADGASVATAPAVSSAPGPRDTDPRTAPAVAPAFVVPAAAPSAATAAKECPPLPPASGQARGEGSAAGGDREAARAERAEAQIALEIGDLRRAVNVASRAVGHDPESADGWLLLAAAHLELGDDLAARRALTACRARAVRGPRGECIAVLESQTP